MMVKNEDDNDEGVDDDDGDDEDEDDEDIENCHASNPPTVRHTNRHRPATAQSFWMGDGLE